VGIVSDILIDGSRLPEYHYTVGLSGEHAGLPTRASAAVPPVTRASAAVPSWFQASFPSPPHTPALAVDFTLSGAKKGAVWVNGFMLGRYWGILSSSEGCQGQQQCSSAAYTGPYSDSRCRSGCGERSQSLYKIPLGLLHPSGR
jgi:hypothetical protein